MFLYRCGFKEGRIEVVLAEMKDHPSIELFLEKVTKDADKKCLANS